MIIIVPLIKYIYNSAKNTQAKLLSKGKNTFKVLSYILWLISKYIWVLISLFFWTTLGNFTVLDISGFRFAFLDYAYLLAIWISPFISLLFKYLFHNFIMYFLYSNLRRLLHILCMCVRETELMTETEKEIMCVSERSRELNFMLILSLLLLYYSVEGW